MKRKKSKKKNIMVNLKLIISCKKKTCSVSGVVYLVVKLGKIILMISIVKKFTKGKSARNECDFFMFQLFKNSLKILYNGKDNKNDELLSCITVILCLSDLLKTQEFQFYH